MKVRVSKTVRVAYGRQWKKEVTLLLESALAAREMSEGEATSFTAPAQMWIEIKVDKRGATVTARPDFLPELDECNLKL